MTQVRSSQSKPGAEPPEMPAGWFTHTLPRTLLHAFYWVDDALQNYMLVHASFSLPRAQSMLMVCIGSGIQRQTEIAKVLRVSKQAVQQGVRELVRKGLVEVVADQIDGRGKIVRFTRQGQSMRDVARKGIQEIERELARRIGKDRAWLLQEILGLSWGSPPDFSVPAADAAPAPAAGIAKPRARRRR